MTWKHKYIFYFFPTAEEIMNGKKGVFRFYAHSKEGKEWAKKTGREYDYKKLYWDTGNSKKGEKMKVFKRKTKKGNLNLFFELNEKERKQLNEGELFEINLKIILRSEGALITGKKETLTDLLDNLKKELQIKDINCDY